MKSTVRRLLLLVAALTFATLSVLAQGTTPTASPNTAPITNWLQDPASTLAFDIRSNFWSTAFLTLPFLLLPEILLLIIIWKFRESRGHAAATFHDNWKLEVVWTAVPVLTLIAIAIPTYATLHKIDVPPKSDLVVEVIGHQFFWEYRYPALWRHHRQRAAGSACRSRGDDQHHQRRRRALHGGYRPSA